MNNFRKPFTLVLSIILIFSTLQLPGYGAQEDYYDIEGHWANEEIGALINDGIVDGISIDGTMLINPNGQITRGEFIKLVISSLIPKASLDTFIESSLTTSIFDDSLNHWAFNYIQIAKYLGIVDGYPDGTFKPDNQISRAEAVKIIISLTSWMRNYTVEGAVPFNDITADYWAYDYCMIGRSIGLIAGYDGNIFKPDYTLLRCEAMVMVYRFIETNTAHEAIDDQDENQTETYNNVSSASSSSSSSVRSNYNLTIQYNENAIMDYTVASSYNPGSAVAVRMRPNQYYQIDEWTSSGGGYFQDTSSTETTFYMPSSDVSVSVTLTLEFDEDGDEDGDSLINSEELVQGTDPYIADTDADGLSDYQEVYLTNTDPLLNDTDSDNTLDADEDPDIDNLSNVYEIILGTNPLSNDTDGDSLSDDDEVSIYFTNPILYDTDNDGISDGDELQLGTDPTLWDTDHDGISDGDETFLITKSLAGVDVDPNVVPTITMDIPGEIVDSLTIQKIDGDDLLLPETMPGYIGSGYDFSLDGTFDAATLTFTFDVNLLADPNFEPAIYYYDEINQEMVLLGNQTIDYVNGTISVEITHFSKYILLNKKDFEAVWDEDIRPHQTNPNTNNALVIAMSIDSSGSMTINDPHNLRLDAAKEFVDLLSDDDEAAIIDFDEDAELLSPLTSSKVDLYSAIEEIDSYGGTDIGAGLALALNQIEDLSDTAKYVIILTDGDGSYDTRLTQKAIDKGVVIYTIGLGDAVNQDLLTTIASQTGGKYYHASSADELSDYFADAAQETIDYETDTDNDGLSDYYEKLIDNGSIRGFNGTIYHVDYQSNDTDQDHKIDSSEISIRSNSNGYVYCYITSDPSNPDTDYDGIGDNEDSAPFDNSFEGSVVRLKRNGSIQLQGDISFTMDYREFFDDNTIYDADISVASILYALDIYSGDYVTITEGASLTGNHSTYDLLDLFGMEDIYMTNVGTDNDKTEVAIGHHPVTYNGEAKEIIQVVVRGTNGTFEEWSSNFDIGADTDAYYEATGLAQNGEWINKDHHKGFDVTANRVINTIEAYLNFPGVTLQGNAEKVIWISGHSRGGGIANLLGKYYEDQPDYESFIYTYASPNTTTESTPLGKNYDTIFNIVNSDDMIPQLPLAAWDFTKYGTTMPVSVEEYYEDKSPFGDFDGSFEAFLDEDYNNNNKLNSTLAAFLEVASSREDLYEYTQLLGTISYYQGIQSYSQSSAETFGELLHQNMDQEFRQFCQFGGVQLSSTYTYDGSMVYVPYFYQTPAYLLQVLALMAVDSFDGVVLKDVAPDYEQAKRKFIFIGNNFTGGLEHPHIPETYVLITINNFEDLK